MAYRTAGYLLLIIILMACSNARSQTPAPTLSPKPTPTTALGSEFHRWFDIEAFTLSTRYRYVRNNAGVVTNNQAQWQTQFRPRLKFDSKGKYSIAAVIATGNVFNGGWNNLGPGTGKPQSNLFVKQLFFDAKPTKKMELQFGGLDINRGEGTEITTFDNDGYITGERVVVRAPKTAWFDEISATNAYLGDINHPSIFSRLHRLNNWNYHQLLVRKQATKYVGLSADYTFWAGADILHEAIRIKPRNFFFSTLLLEGYERVSSPNGQGFNAFVEHTVNKKLAINGGVARIDRRMTLNADRFPPGKRVYAGLVYKPNKEFVFQPIMINGVGRLPAASTPRTRIDLILTWNVLETLHRHHVL
jgi:hypothetical protein